MTNSEMTFTGNWKRAESPAPMINKERISPLGIPGIGMMRSAGHFCPGEGVSAGERAVTEEDVVSGNGAVPETLNRYGYCWGNPVGLVDLNGKKPNETDTYCWPDYEEILEYNEYELANLFEGFDEQESESFFMEMMRQAKESKVLEVHIQYGTGIYGKVNVEGIGGK